MKYQLFIRDLKARNVMHILEVINIFPEHAET